MQLRALKDRTKTDEIPYLPNFVVPQRYDYNAALSNTLLTDGDSIFYRDLRLVVIGGSGEGTVDLSYDNCPADTRPSAHEIILSPFEPERIPILYPNPVQFTIRLILPEEELFVVDQITLVDQSGKEHSPRRESLEIEVKSIPTGLCFLRIEVSGKVSQYKVLIIR